jgi:hypothetical protein
MPKPGELDSSLAIPDYATKQVKDDWTPYLAQIQKAIEQLGDLQEPENFERKVGEEGGKYIVDAEEPL